MTTITYRLDDRPPATAACSPCLLGIPVLIRSDGLEPTSQSRLDRLVADNPVAPGEAVLTESYQTNKRVCPRTHARVTRSHTRRRRES